ncbi:hypothetical protein JKF63_04123 [Porcisia hertigi]|uniref:non-specific serine/threonine protein kinase n=1 Tax=Porcisia hertigi TaxID=2761500 RepID=A0A836ISF7_9TRYP|nr:hypothetical protein JKF63_04123 [Porcisia hertigi]
MHRRRQQHHSIAADSSSSQTGFVPNEVLDTRTASTTLGDASCGASTNLNSCGGALMTSIPHQQGGGNDTSNGGYEMRPEKLLHPNRLTQTEMLTSPLPAHPENASITRMIGSSSYRHSLDSMRSRQEHKQQQPTPQRRAPGSQATPIGASSSAPAGGARPLSVPTSAVDGSTIVPRRYGENNSPALNTSLGEGTPTAATSVPHRHPLSSSFSWPHQASESSPFTRAGAPSSHPGWQFTMPLSRESMLVVPPKASIAATSTPHAAGDSAPGGGATDRASDVTHLSRSPLRRLALAQIQSPVRLSRESHSPYEHQQPVHPPAPMSSSPQVVKSPAMFGVIDLSYSRTDASGSKMTPRVSAGSTAVGANAVGKTHGQASASRGLTIKVNTRSSSLPRNRAHTPVMSANYTDPAAAALSSSSTTATTTAATAPLGSKANCEFTARYGTTIVRMGHSTGRSDCSSLTVHSTPNRSHDAASVATTSMETTTPRCSSRADPQTPVHASTINSQHGTLLTPPSPPPVERGHKADETEDQQQRNVSSSLHHTTFGAPVTVVAARARKPSAVHHGTLVDAARKPERPTQTPLLTANTVLPVAVREDEVCLSSSVATTLTRSRSNSRAHPSSSASLSRSTISTTMTTTDKAGGAARQERVGGTAHTAGSISTSTLAARENRPRDRFASTFSLGRSYPAGHMPTVASSASASPVDPGVSASARDAHVRCHASGGPASTGSAFSGLPQVSSMLASYSFISSRNHMQRYIDQWRDRFEEDKGAYKEGGYLTVTPGRIVHSRYVLVQKLGWGEFSTVWLGYDTKHSTMGRGLSQAFVAVKVAKCRSSVQEATLYEVSLLRYLEARLPKHIAITNIIDCFDVRGEFGMHTCMVLPLCGPNLLSIIESMKANHGRRSAEDLRMIKEIIGSVLISLHELSVLNVVHTDIKPENVLCSAVDSRLVSSMERFCSYNQERSHMISLDQFRESVGQHKGNHLICLADFGLSALLEPPSSAPLWVSMCGNVDRSLLAPLMRCKKNFPVMRSGVMDNQRGTLIQTREYRAPEVLLGLDFTCATDIWSVGCMAFELITGSFLMDPKKKTRDPREMDIEHLAMMMQLIGPLPVEITSIRVRNNAYYDALVQGKPLPKCGSTPPPEYLHRFVDRNGNFIYASRFRSYPRRNLELELEPYLGFREARFAANFILSCLYSYDPKQRPSAKALLGHQWLQGLSGSSKKASPL